MANKKKYKLINTTSISGKNNKIFRYGGESFAADELPEGAFDKYFEGGYLQEVKESAKDKKARLAAEKDAADADAKAKADADAKAKADADAKAKADADAKAKADADKVNNPK